VAKECSGQPLLIVGDLNTGNQMSDKTPAGTKYDCSEHFDRLSQREGLVDLWRRSNGADVREWTWYSTARNGFRLDHAFGNRVFVDLFGPSCRYDHRPREVGFRGPMRERASVEGLYGRGWLAKTAGEGRAAADRCGDCSKEVGRYAERNGQNYR